VFYARFFMRALQDLTVERVRQELQSYFDDETISIVAARRFIEKLPAGVGDYKIVDRDRMRELIRALDEPDSPALSSRALASARGTEDGNGATALGELERRALELLQELPLASAACMLLLGLAAWQLSRSGARIDAAAHAAKIGVCGAVLIGFGSAITWRLGTASQGCAAPAIVLATCVVLILMGDARFNGFRATRAVFGISRFWP
jgi:hypothetical protein